MSVQLKTMQFPLLLEASAYLPYTFEYVEKVDREGMPTVHDWIEVFRRSIPSFVKAMKQDPSQPEDQREANAQKFAEEFDAICTKLHQNPTCAIDGFPAGQLNCIKLCRMRDRIQHGCGFPDPFKIIKDEENQKALQYLPVLLEEIDAISDTRSRIELVIKGVFAGNIFDLGAAHSSQLFEKGDAAFQDTRLKLQERPWTIDDLDSLLEALITTQYQKAVLFVDNAGSDIILGMLPFARELIKFGTKVVLSANEAPNINDITHQELTDVVQRAAQFDRVINKAINSGWLSCVSSGNDLPVIDLRFVSEELAQTSKDADLVVLEGMGRSIETNLNAQMNCDSVCLGMIKHPEVTACLNGELYGCVCRFKKVDN